MSTPVPLPALGESVTEGTISRWLKKVGDYVEVDEPLVEVSTDKVDTEIPAPVAGVLLEILVDEDGVAPVGATLGVIGEASEAGSAPAAPAAEPPAAAPAEAPAPVAEPAPAAEAPAPAAPAPSAAPSSAGSTEVKLPQLGESVTEGTISRWLKAVGDQVEADEPLVEVSTDKVDTEIPAPVSGTLLQILVAEDGVAPVGAVLAVIGAADAAPAAPAAPAPAAPAAAPAPAPAAPAAAPAPAQAAAPAPAQAAAPAAAPRLRQPRLRPGRTARSRCT